MKPAITIIVLIISVAALLLSAYNFYLIFQISQKADKMAADLKPIIEKVQPLLPEFETLNKVMPRLQQLLLSIPPR